MNGKNLKRKIGGFVLAALLLFSVGIMSSTAVEARGHGRGGFHGGGFHGHGFGGPRFGVGVGYPYGYPYGYPPYGAPYVAPYVHFGFRR